jgi:hypothetical protein
VLFSAADVLLAAFFFGVTQLEAFSLSSVVVMVTLGGEKGRKKHEKF